MIVSTPHFPGGGSWGTRIAKRHAVVLGLVGLLATTAQVFAVGRSSVPVGMVLPDHLSAVLSRARLGGTVPAAIVVVSWALLLSCWWYMLAQARRGRLPMRWTAWIVVAWAVPVLPGPPLFSFDAYAYLAQGQMMAHGLDPYSVGPVTLGSDSILGMVDPLWRSSPAPYGPVVLLLMRVVAMTHVGPTSAVLVLRVVALVGVAAAVIGALLLSPRERRPAVLVLTLANPITLIQLVGGVHIDAALSGLVVVALLALHAGRARSALVIAGVALACKVTVLPLFLLVAVILVRRRGPRLVWLALGAVIAPFAATGLVLNRPWGFINALGVSGAPPAWYAPSSLAGLVLRALTAAAGAPLGWRQAHLAGLGAVLLAGAVVVVKTLRSARLDAGPDAARRDMVRAGVVLLVPMLALPSLFGWYLGPAVFVVAAASGTGWRRVLVALCSLLSFCALPPTYDPFSWLLVGAWTVALGICVAGVRRCRPTSEPGGPPVVPARAATARLAQPTPPGQADAFRPGTPLPRVTLIVVGAAESMLVLLLVALVAVRSAQATDQAHATTQAQLASRTREVIAVGQLVSSSYPGWHLARVLAQPSRLPTDVIDFDVELVSPGTGACWIRIGVPAGGAATRPAELHGVPSNGHRRCPEPSRQSRRPAPDNEVPRPK